MRCKRLKITDFIGEATGYDKKEMMEERKPPELAQKRQCLCQRDWWSFDFWCI